ncbi:hypothetical protein PsorP6_010513 [Peronosclerospora sorghi]|uniref:Uncharacterized protein n=1 Tax=Peronosclerospora sorghi TaxID=230839 RepID=A0ACC0VWT7_9STRA|nr:hypothetical protein PsorP6_010513 [Peronosclerospora sorghi]
MRLGHAELMNRACGISWDARDERQLVPELWTAVYPGKVKELSLAGCAVGEVKDFRGAPEAAAVPYPSVMPESIPNAVGARQTHRGREDAGAGRWDFCLRLRFTDLLMDEFEGVV